MNSCSRKSFLFKKLRNISFQNVSTLSPLANTFNSYNLKTKTESANKTGLFCIPELSEPHGFTSLTQDVLRCADKLVDKAVEYSPSPDVVDIFDNLSNELCKVADLAEFIRLAHPNVTFAKEAEKASFEIGGYVEKLNTHLKLYEAINNSVSTNGKEMDPLTKHVAELFIFDFKQSGIHLNENQRQQAVGLHQAVLILGARFTDGANSERLIPLKNWPRDLKIPYPIENNCVVVDSPYNESQDSRLRQFSYQFYMSSSKEQVELLDTLLLTRQTLARLIGFPSFAHRVLNASMASKPSNVTEFLEKTLSMLESPLEHEMNRMRNYRQRYTNDVGHINAWDLRHISGLVTTQLYNINASKMREYFSVGSCMEGVNILFNSLFGISLNVIDSVPGEIWNDDVMKLEVTHETEGILGYIYCDLYQRQGKLPQDCHFTIRGGKLLEDGSYQTPIICLNCNFPQPSPSKPSLLTQGMVENLFHEMGHAMHSMLGRARYQHVTGTRCATDFAEVPSILMEYFALDHRILPLYAKHYETGEPLPDDIARKLRLSKNLFNAVDLQTQSFYSLVDQTLHGEKYPFGRDTSDVIIDLHRRYNPVAHTQDSHWHLRFSHFHSYAAKYYSYVWSKAVASRIWHSCFESDPLSRGMGERYRKEMLQYGGGMPPWELVNSMLGSDININDLVSSLEIELEK